MGDCLWKLDHVTVHGHNRPRLEHVSLEIQRGVTAVLGHSGAGKTTLLNLLVGFERPSRGQIQRSSFKTPLPSREGLGDFGELSRVEGRDDCGLQIADCGLTQRGAIPDLAASPRPRVSASLAVFWSPQDDGLWPHLSVREHLSYVAPGGQRSVERIDELLARFDLTDLADRRPDSLSQGERSRLSVARAMASEASVLVMDEPLVHVDPARVGPYRQAVVDWCRANNVSLVLASHSPEVVLANACDVVCLCQGRLLFDGAVDELYYRPASRELAEFLGPVNWLSGDDCGLWIANFSERGTRSAECGAFSDLAASPRPRSAELAAGRVSASLGPCCIRPEQLSITGCAESPLVVESARFAGSVAEVDLRHEQHNQRRRFYHRPPRNVLKAGDRVLLRLLLLLFVCWMQAGCEGDDGPSLPVKSTRYWQLPTDGPKIPTPRRMTVGPDDSLYVLDDAGRVLVYGADGKLARRWSMPESTVGNPESVLVLRDGRIAVADTHYHRVVFFDAAGKVLKMMGSEGSKPGQYIYPVALAEDDDQNLYVCEYGGNDRVQKYSHDGKFVMQFGTHGVEDGQFQRPSGIVWRQGKIYVADAFNNRIQVFSDRGEFLSSLGSTAGAASLKYPYDLCFDSGERLLVVEYEAGRVTSMDLAGKLLGRFGSTGFGDRQFSTPWGLAVDSRQTIYIADTGNRRIVALER